MFVNLIQGLNLKKEIEELIKEKANNIYEKYYSNNPDFALNEEINDKTNFVNKICIILKTHKIDILLFFLLIPSKTKMHLLGNPASKNQKVFQFALLPTLVLFEWPAINILYYLFR